MIQNHKSTEGEEIIEFYLEDEEIRYEREFPIYNLKNDPKSFRKADFYLPKYKVYLEFLGEWNDQDGRKRYQEKMRIYDENRIPCIYIFPDNLGALDIVFRIRMRKLFKNHPELSAQRLAFNFWKLKKLLGIGLWSWVLLTFAYVLYENILNKNLSFGVLSATIPLVVLIALVIYFGMKIFKKPD